MIFNLTLSRCLSYLALWLGVLLLSVWHMPAHAHKPSDSYLAISIVNNTQKTATAQWDIAVRDIDYAIGLDSNANNEITWQEVLSKQTDIAAYALARLSIKNQQTACDLNPTQLLIDNHTDGAYAVIQFSVNCKQAMSALQLHYRLFADIDPSHRGLLKLNYVQETNDRKVTNDIKATKDSNSANSASANAPQKFSKTAIFSPDNAIQTFVLSNPSRIAEFKQYVIEGVWHIWIGFDHILFLISLLLPAVLVYSAKKWQPAQQFKTTFVDVLKVVTAFTVAHSITLTLATLQVIELPSRWVEAAIAASVILAALNNLLPYLLKRRWLAAFIFGLIHGFGFAAVLADLGLQQNTLAIALVGFNVGVELGQLAILSVFIPIAYMLRKSWFYQYILFYSGSILIILIASAWFAERAFNITLFAAIPKVLGFI